MPGGLDRAYARRSWATAQEAAEADPVPPRLSGRDWCRWRQVEDEAFYDATSIAAMRIGCLPGNARNAVAMAAIAANTQADRKT